MLIVAMVFLFGLKPVRNQHFFTGKQHQMMISWLKDYPFFWYSFFFLCVFLEFADRLV